MHNTIQRILAISPEVRYVALYQRGTLTTASRPDLSGASSAESDKYEELLVNPTLLTLVRQRGNIDCGGLEYVVIRYGNFFEVVAPIDQGHASVGLEASSDPLRLVPKILAAVAALSPAPTAG